LTQNQGQFKKKQPALPKESPSIENVAFVKSAEELDQLPDDGRPEIAFVGRSNVGKSSLVNLLCGRKNLAKSSSTPGKTRTFNYYDVGGKWYLVDLPGFGYAKVARTERDRWARLIVDYLEQRSSLRLVLHLVDCRHPPGEIDLSLLDLMQGGWVPYIVVLTKTDKLSANQRAKSLAIIKRELASRGMENAVVLSSAEDQRGKRELIEWIEPLVG
jgi:GTP-binding protein